MRAETVLGLIVGIITISFIVVLGYKLSAERQCRDLGYRDGELGFPLEQYCIKRVNQTDVVINLEKLK